MHLGSAGGDEDDTAELTPTPTCLATGKVGTGLWVHRPGPMTSAANYMQYVLKNTITNAVKVFGPAAPAPVPLEQLPEDEVKQDSQES